MSDKKTKRAECECCGYRTILEEFTHGIGNNTRQLWICQLCSGTMASTSMQYGHDDENTLKAICYVGNAILDAINKVGQR